MLMHRDVGGQAIIEKWRGRVLIAAVLLLSLTYWAVTAPGPAMALSLVRSQDALVLAIGAVAMVVFAWWQPAWRLPSNLSNRHYAAAGALLAALLALGSYVVMGDFPLSRDEHMVVFDMAVFKAGSLAMPIASEWRPFALSLVPNFLLNTDDPTGWVSGYLPVNALARAAFSLIADPAWFNPLLLLVGGAALLDIARRAFPGDGRAQLVAMLVYGLSAQLLANAMTTYAMTAHVALNLVWLAAFLRGRRGGHAIAIAVGFLAVGLHQLAFHPLFVAPFLLWKLLQRDWRIVLLYGLAYSAIVLWWALYPTMVSPLVADSTGAASRENLMTQVVIPLLTNRDPRTVPLMILNVMRLLAWQHIALLPLLIAAVPAIRRESLPRALAGGIGLWLLFLILVLPEQGRAWGYRYMNGYIGSFALLAAYGYREIAPQLRAKADGMVIALSGLTMIVSLPLLFNAAHRFLRPHIALDRLIESQQTPFVLIDDHASPTSDGRFRDTAMDHVRNLPDLSNRPLRFSAVKLDPRRLAALCRRGQVTLITRREMHGVGFLLNVPVRSPRFDALTRDSKSDGCFRTAEGRL